MTIGETFAMPWFQSVCDYDGCRISNAHNLHRTRSVKPALGWVAWKIVDGVIESTNRRRVHHRLWLYNYPSNPIAKGQCSEGQSYHPTCQHKPCGAHHVLNTSKAQTP